MSAGKAGGLSGQQEGGWGSVGGPGEWEEQPPASLGLGLPWGAL